MTSTPPAVEPEPMPVDDPTVAFDAIEAPTWFGGEPLPSFAPPDPTMLAATGIMRPAFVPGPAFGGAALTGLEPRHRVPATGAAPVARASAVPRRVLVGLGALGLVGCGFAASSLLHSAPPAAPVLPPLATQAALAFPPGGALPAVPAPALPPASAASPDGTTERSTAATTRPARPATSRTLPRAVAPPAPAAVPPAAAARPGAAAYPPGYAPRPVYRPRTYTPAPQQQQVQPAPRRHSGGLPALLGN